jgi:hypothetical protein
VEHFRRPPGPDRRARAAGEGKPWQGGHDDIVTILDQWCDQVLEFQERSGPAVQQE